MKILIVNDDSISAPGIEVLARAAAKFGDVWVVAPATQCSAMSQRMTLRETLELRKCPDFPVEVRGAWSVSGSPVDCVKVALTNVMAEKPDLVLSGINNGYNVGFDTAYSGTLGAAFEAARNGLPAIALSTANDSHLAAVEPHLEGVLRELMGEKLAEGEVWNVNFPALRTRPLMGILRDRPVAPVAHSLGGQYRISHGLANAVVLPYILSAYGHAVDKKALDICKAMGIDATEHDAAMLLVDRICRMNARMGIPTKLAGIQEEDIPRLARLADKEANPLYPVPMLMSAKELEQFYYDVMEVS